MKNEAITKLADIDKAISKIMIFSQLINSVIVFLVFAIILTLIGIDLRFVIVIILFYLPLALIWKKTRTDTINMVTNLYPALDERLQTVYDNREGDNLILRRLNNDVSRRMDEVCYSSFTNIKRLTFRTFLAILLAFVFLSINIISLRELAPLGSDFLGGINTVGESLGIRTEKPLPSEPGAWESGNYSNEKEKKRIGGETGGMQPGINEGPIPGRGGGTGYTVEQKIFGEPSSARIEGENVNIEIHPEYGGGIEIKDVGENSPESDEFSLSSVRGSNAPGKEPLKYEQIIKNYFEKLIEESE